MKVDRYGAPLEISAEGLDALDPVLTRFHCLEDDVLASLGPVLELDPSCCFTHAWAAVLASDEGDEERAAGELEAAESAASAATERERSYLRAATAYVRDGLWASEGEWWRHHDEFPGDLMALEPLSMYAYFAGRPDYLETMDAVTERSRRAVGEVAPVRDLIGWSAHEHLRLDESHAWAESLLSEEPRWVNAAHIHAHAFYEAGDHESGLSWLDSWVEELADPPSYTSHLSWHAGLHALALGHDDALVPRFLREMRCTVPRLSDGAMTLWRYQLLGIVPPGEDPSGSLAEMARTRAKEPFALFAAYVAALGLACSQDTIALHELAHGAPGSSVPGVAELVPGLAEGLALWVEGDPVGAADVLSRVEPHFDRFGGSVAQRDPLYDTYVAILAAAGRDDEALAYAEARDARRGWKVDRRLLRARRGAPGPT